MFEVIGDEPVEFNFCSFYEINLILDWLTPPDQI